ncbi:Lon protease family protein [Vibrio sp. TH_r3]|uniref:Lon protease family protein n=1 Tax=Vibrio sp. TH_r3 TaxID=3082084 RepID=UPI002952B556|nr:Lon protease family protein [Vibrio sp. TH_r3]MDV7104364.1 Lon protease family protein [Vibrio sp. TH_r3]
MKQEDWRSVTLQFDKYEAIIDSFPTLSPLSFFDLQPRLRAALLRFEQLHNWTKVLLINSPDNAIYRNAILDAIHDEHLVPDERVVVKAETLEIRSILGEYKAKDGKVESVAPGLLRKAHGGYLVVSANLIMANPSSWMVLKSALLGESVSPVSVDTKHIAIDPPTQKIDVKLIVIGDREQLSELDYFDSDMNSGFCMFSEVELESKLNEITLTDYLAYLKGLIKSFGLPSLDSSGIRRLLTAGTRECEDQHAIPLCLQWHNALLSEAALQAKEGIISEDEIDKALNDKYFRESYLPKRALDDILDGQVIIETDGEHIGQVNGLTVVDVPGHPISYGEPARISCVIHFGDGDILDVERKAELGGNLHAKGMMIMQALVSTALDLDEVLPYSASIVFEQSYCEVDGDSASLAEFCCLVSALSETPLNQQLAVTGAVDQFGRVQAVGGLNEKIEGFYHVCKHQGFTGNQGVILPKSNLKHLSLDKDVINSIKQGQFSIWAVENVDQAIALITGKQFRGESDDAILNRISDRIAFFNRRESHGSFFQRILNRFITN